MLKRSNYSLINNPRKPKNSLDIFLEINIQMRQIRFLMLISFLFGVWTIIAFYVHPLAQFTEKNLFFDLLPTNNSPIIYLIARLLTAYFSLDTIIDLALIFIAIWFALTYSAQYLKNIFGLKKIKNGVQFILHSAFYLLPEETINIENGQIPPHQKDSILLKIGGPGKAVIGLENAAVFEFPHGDVEIIGPTVNQKGSFFHLQTFERLHSIIDLRNHKTQLSITARTKDGIRVLIKDLQIIFNIQRSDNKITLTRPYPFDPHTIAWLVYQQPKGPWTENFTRFVRELFRNQIRQHTLSELFSPIIQPEIEEVAKSEIAVQNRIWREKKHLLYQTKPHTFFQPRNPKMSAQRKRLREISTAPHFPLYLKPHVTQPEKLLIRTAEMRHVFQNQFFESITNQINQKGINLSWVQTGIFESPIKSIIAQHQEAWRLACENSAKRDPKNIEKISLQTKKDVITQAIRDILNIEHVNRITLENKLDLNLFYENVLNFLKSTSKRNSIKKSENYLKINAAIQIMEKYKNQQTE